MTANTRLALHHVLAATASPNGKPAPGEYRVDIAIDGRLAGEYCQLPIAGILRVGPRGGLRWTPDVRPKYLPKKRRK